jgi:hypothetical protein
MNINQNEKRDLFFYVVVTDRQLKRENRLAQLFEEEVFTYYIGPNDTHMPDLVSARFWKDQPAAIRRCEHLRSRGSKFDFELRNLSREEFIKLIPDKLDKNNYCYLRNLELKKQEIKYLKRIYGKEGT